MVASNFTVNGYAPTPVLEFGVARDKFLYNRDSANTLYLGTDRGVTSSSGFPMGPASTRRWVAGDPLFAICESGKSAVLNISDNAGEYNDPAANAAQILQQGLAGQIASAINLVGVPSIDRPTLLYADTRVVAGGSFANYLPILDVSQYKSLYVAFSETPTASYTGTLGRTWVMTWADSSGLYTISQEDLEISAADGSVYGVIPSKGATLAMLGTNSGVDSTVKVHIYGSYRDSVEKLNFAYNGIATANPLTAYFGIGYGALVFSGTTGAAGTYTAYPTYETGNYTLYLSVSSATATLVLRDLAGGAELVKIVANGAGVPHTLRLQSH